MSNRKIAPELLDYTKWASVSEQLISDANAVRYPQSTFQDPVDLLARFMMAEAIQAGSRTCLLFVDEAQMLTVMQVRYLLEIWNELRQEGFILECDQPI